MTKWKQRRMAAALQEANLHNQFVTAAIQVIMPSVVDELKRRSYSEDRTRLLKSTAAKACIAMADELMKARAA